MKTEKNIAKSIDEFGLEDDTKLLTTLLFSEASKKPEFLHKDATAIACVITNRLTKPSRFGKSLRDIVFAPYQFSGVNSNEWQKAVSKKFTEKEKEIYEELYGIAHDALSKAIEDVTGGADHYFNPSLVMPKWAEKMTKVYSSGAHDFYAESIKV